MAKYRDGHGCDEWARNADALPEDERKIVKALRAFVTGLGPTIQYSEDAPRKNLHVCTPDTLTRTGRIFSVICLSELIVPTYKKLKGAQGMRKYIKPTKYYAGPAAVLRIVEDMSFLKVHFDDAEGLLRDAYKLSS